MKVSSIYLKFIIGSKYKLVLIINNLNFIKILERIKSVKILIY